jgi:hypothetical protein
MIHYSSTNEFGEDHDLPIRLTPIDDPFKSEIPLYILSGPVEIAHPGSVQL